MSLDIPDLQPEITVYLYPFNHNALLVAEPLELARFQAVHAEARSASPVIRFVLYTEHGQLLTTAGTKHCCAIETWQRTAARLTR